MIRSKIAIVIGSTGLVGKKLVEQLISDSSISKIRLLQRRKSGINHEKVEEHIVDFDHVNSYEHLIKGDILFSCMGTTLKQAGSKEAQYKVDYTYQFEVAKQAAANGVLQYVLVSSANANAKSSIFYSRIKGELDEAAMRMDFEQILIIRPSVLIGEREQKRAGEEMGAKVIHVLAKIIPSLKKYRGIRAEEVAAAMIQASKRNTKEKTTIYTLDELFDLISK